MLYEITRNYTKTVEVEAETEDEAWDKLDAEHLLDNAKLEAGEDVIESVGEDRWINPDIDMTKIVSSMQIDSGEEICSLKRGNHEVSVGVRGEVKVFIGDDEYFTHPSDFPDELKQLIANNPYDWMTMSIDKGLVKGDIYVSENNWFEIFFYENGQCISSDVVDIEGQTDAELFDLMDNSMVDWITAYKEKEATEPKLPELTPKQERMIYNKVKHQMEIETAIEDINDYFAHLRKIISNEDARVLAEKIVDNSKQDVSLARWDNISDMIDLYGGGIKTTSLDDAIGDIDF